MNSETAHKFLQYSSAQILLKIGRQGRSTSMRNFLTGYSIHYNPGHGRHGHSFRNRYQSTVCEKEPYLMKLVSG